MPVPAIEAVEVTKRYRSRGADTTALDAASLSVRSGEFVCLLGPSGCGKSTLLQMMAGLQLPSSGRLTVDGRSVTGPPPGLIYVFQQYTKSIFPWKTVLQNVLFGLMVSPRLDRREAEARARHWIEMMGLTGFESHYPKQLSGGMQQRVALARAMACQPRILLMDEPFSSVDALTRATLQDAVSAVWREGELTVVFVTHDIEEAIYLGQRVVVMSRGPGRVSDILDVPLGHPRDQIATRESPGYLALRQKLYASIMGPEQGSPTDAAVHG